MKQKGFTLIELLVVIAIIGILSSIVIANISKARTNAQETAIKAQLKELVTVLTAYLADVGGVSGSNSEQPCISPESLFDTTNPPFGNGANYTAFNAMNNNVGIKNASLALYNNKAIDIANAGYGGGAPTGGGPYRGACSGGSLPSADSINFSVVVKSKNSGKFYCASTGKITVTEVSAYSNTCN